MSLVIVCGPPCTGKSTIAEALQSQSPEFTHVEVDRIRERVMPDSDQRQEHRDIAYRAMHLVAQHLIHAGRNVIVNATYNREIHREELSEMLESTRCPAFLVQCKAPRDLVIARFKNRPPGHPALDLTEDKVVQLLTGFAYSRDGILVDTSRPQDVCFPEIAAYVESGQPASLKQWVRMK